MLYVFAQTVVLIIYALATQMDLTDQTTAENLMYDGDLLSIATFASLAITLPAVFGIIWLKKSSSFKNYLALKRPSIRESGLWILIMFGWIVLSDGLSLLLGKPIVVEFMTRSMTSATYPALLILAFVIAAPLLEELFFRGFLYRGLCPSFLKTKGTIILTSLLWALIHTQYDFYTITSIFTIGILLGAARHKTGSLYIPILLHALINLVASVQTLIVLAQ